MTSAIGTIRNLGGRLGAFALLGAGRFLRNTRGATAVEFSLVALPFFALMFAILETALAFFAQNYFEDTLARVSRQVRTGQAQKASMTSDQFKTAMCAYLSPMFNCPGGLTIDLKTYSKFADVSLAIPVYNNPANANDPKNGTLDPTQATYSSTSASGAIVVVRAYYSWPVFVNRLGNNLATMPDGTHLLVATAAFRNEPFPW